MSENKDSLVLIELTTIPETAWAFFRGRLRFFQEMGFTVYLISSPGELMEKINAREGIEVIPVALNREITPLKDLGSLYQILRIFLKLKPLIVHSHTPKASLLGMLASAILRVPIRFFTIHGLNLEAKGVSRWLLQISDSISSRLAHQTFCVSKSVTEIAIAQKIVRPERIKVLLNGSINGVDSRYFDPEKFGKAERARLRNQYQIPESALVIGYVGRIVRDKGMIELAEAWNTLRKEFPQIHLILVGPFEKQDPVPDPVKKLFQTDPRIHLTGYVADVAPFYAVMDLVVLPTYREGFPYVPLEAQAMRLSVITTRVPGAIDSIIDGITGILIPCKNAKALAQAMRNLINNPDLRDNMGKAGRDRVLREFRPEDIWEALFQEYKRFLEEKGIPEPKPRDSAW